MNEENLPMGPEPVEALRKALTEAYERGVAHGEARERARWEKSCERTIDATSYYNDPNMGMAARDAVRSVKATCEP